MNITDLLRKWTTVLLFFLFFVPFYTRAAEPKEVISINININMDWNHRGSGNTRTIGTFMVNVTGKARLTEKKGECLKYEPVGMKATGKFKQRTIQEAEHFDCSGQVIMRMEGFETVPVSADNFLIISNLGHLGKVAAMQYKGNFNIEDMFDQKKNSDSDNYSSMLVASFKCTQRGGCGNEGYFKEGIIPIALNIFKELTPMGMHGSYTWKSKDGLPSFMIGIGDFKGDRRFNPSKGQGARYRVSWNFDESKPILQIWRKGKNITYTNQEVKVGEKIELECKVIPKFEGKPEYQEWFIDEGYYGKKRYIKKFDASKEKGEVLKLTENDLKKPKIIFYWKDAGDGTVKCKAKVKGENIDAQTEFSVRKPDYQVKVDAKKSSALGNINTGGTLPKGECCIDKSHKGKGPIYGLQYDGIEFECESKEQEKSFQWVQLINDELYYDNSVRQDWTWNIKGLGLDHCYPYEHGKKAKDQPGMEAPKNPENTKEEVYIFRVRKTQTSMMYLMYRPEGKDNEWVPLCIVEWTWQGSIIYKNKWLKDVKLENPAEWKIKETSKYPEWAHNTCDSKKWECSTEGKKRPWQQ